MVTDSKIDTAGAQNLTQTIAPFDKIRESIPTLDFWAYWLAAEMQ